MAKSISRSIPHGRFNSRKHTINGILIVITSLIILKILQLSNYCSKLATGDTFRVYGTIFERPISEKSQIIVNFQQFQFNFKNLSKESVLKIDNSLGRRVELSGKIAKITKRSLFTSEILPEKHTKSEEKSISYYNSTDSQNFSTSTGGVIPIYACDIELIGQSFLTKRGVGYSGNALLSVFFLEITRIQERIVQLFSRSLPEPHGSLSLGMLLGVNPQMSKTFRDNLVATGLLHVVAASGYNINLISAVVQRTLNHFLRKSTAQILSGAMIVIYLILAGMSASVIRAGMMGILSLLATSSGKLYRVKWALLLTILGMLWWAPLLAFSASFQLSVAATFGIIFLLPRITPQWVSKPPKNNDSFILNIMRSLFENLLTTTAASLMTIPIILISFGRVSLISFLANTILVSLVPWIMTLATIFLVVGSVVPSLTLVAVLPLWSVTQLFIVAVNGLAKVPYAQLEILNVSEWWMVVWWVGIGLFMKLRPIERPTVSEGADG